ncbi:MAG: chorismate mutase [Hydrotalea flava]|uniref:prephenate dehydratase n=1 Tax=Hydrotalea TaxID=1004300 RepID=UPI001027DCE7|nr:MULTISPECIES: prephenate dehydratase [Hydrotalea]MBY0349240.1 prephenate dehydratase [Hydrotalea flava]GHU01077.1 prephenate dehydratase [Betaproteobacteria bacterium]NIM35920.1 chorismate mutase [Hydrotalea flava]NIM38753.1 chorismate mutase [Hydrotalea flava]NIN03941.1 chorismate mutase [Hydrotalea flava]
MKKKIAIQGYEGSFHHMAAIEYFGKNVEIIACATFKDLVKIAGTKKESNGGIMAIENSIVGSILPNYGLLQKGNLQITGEVYLPVKQHLMVDPGVRIEDIKEVHSHPMAIQQCLEFLEKHNWKLVETEDTALSAQILSTQHKKAIAAIASSLAAELYELDIIAPNIQTQKNNYTRFLVVERTEDATEAADANKATVHFATDHTKGSLAKVLTIIADNGINLSKLQSMPIAGTNFKYSFYADMEFENVNELNKVLKLLKPHIDMFKNFGIYKNGNI